MFGKGKEERQAEKEARLMARYRLEEISNPDDVESVKTIAQELLGTGLLELGTKISFGKEEEKVMMSYLRAIVEQNFIMIRQLDRIAKK